MKDPGISPRAFYIFVIVLLGLSLFRLGYFPIKFEEPRRALVALEMQLSGNYITPTINGFYYYNKPPIYNWFLNVLFEIFGYENWVVRLPSVLSFIGISLITFFFFRHRVGEQVALLGAWFFLLAINLLFYFSFQGEIDLFYSLIVYLQILSILHFHDKKSYGLLFFFSYLLMALGVLTKGIPSIAFQAITLLAVFIYHKEFWKLLGWKHFVFALMGFGLIGLYFWAYSIYHDPWSVIGKMFFESSRRTVDQEGIGSYAIHFISFPVLILYLLSPGWLFIFPMKKSKLKGLLNHRWIVYSLLFILPNLFLYWFSPGTRDRYLYMFLPFLFIIIAFLVDKPLSKYYSQVLKGIYLLAILAVLVSFFIKVELAGFNYVMLSVGILLLLALFFIQKQNLHPVISITILLIIVRIAFAFTAFESRKNTGIRQNIKRSALEVAKIVGERELKFYSPVKTDTLNYLGITQYPQSIDRLSFAFSFHLEKELQKILFHSDSLEKNVLYLLEDKYMDQIKNLSVLQQVSIHKDTYYLVEVN